jgi:hypothetical protein
MDYPKTLKQFQRENASTKEVCDYFLNSPILNLLTIFEIELIQEIAQKSDSTEKDYPYILKDVFIRIGQLLYRDWRKIKKLPLD